jgi:hypothetical protein
LINTTNGAAGQMINSESIRRSIAQTRVVLRRADRLLAAAPSTEFAVIEFDHYGCDIFDGIQASVDYLSEHWVK